MPGGVEGRRVNPEGEVAMTLIAIVVAAADRLLLSINNPAG